MYDRLLHPDLFSKIPFVGNHIAAQIDELASRDAALPAPDPGVSVVIRTLNESERLGELLKDIQKQDYAGEVEVIVVDNESTDATQTVAKAMGARVVTLAREEFTYPRSMNLGMQAASHNLVWLSVGHALPTTTQLLAAGARTFDDPLVAGVFATPVLPNNNATLTERLTATGAEAALRLPRDVKKVQMGVLAATSAMIRKDVWEKLGGFDEAYETGGEDTALAREMLRSGFRLVRDPLLSVHHSHGLGPIDSLKQLRSWQASLKRPTTLQPSRLAGRRTHFTDQSSGTKK